MNTGMVVIIALITLSVGIIIGYWLHYSIAKQEKARLQIKVENILTDAEEKAKDIEMQAKDKALQIRQQAEAEVSRRRTEISREEDRLVKRREELDNRTDRQEKREAALNKRQSAIDKRSNEVEQMYENEMAELERISQMTQDEARTFYWQKSKKTLAMTWLASSVRWKPKLRKMATGAHVRSSPLPSSVWHLITSVKSPLPRSPFPRMR